MSILWRRRKRAAGQSSALVRSIFRLSSRLGLAHCDLLPAAEYHCGRALVALAITTQKAAREMRAENKQ